MPDIVQADVSTDTVVERDFTKAECEITQIVQSENVQIDIDIQNQKIARDSAIAKLKKLGLTDDEVSALIGGAA